MKKNKKCPFFLYIHAVMNHIGNEWESMPIDRLWTYMSADKESSDSDVRVSILLEMRKYLKKCFQNKTCISNAAGAFVEKFGDAVGRTTDAP